MKEEMKLGELLEIAQTQGMDIIVQEISSVVNGTVAECNRTGRILDANNVIYIFQEAMNRLLNSHISRVRLDSFKPARDTLKRLRPYADKELKVIIEEVGNDGSNTDSDTRQGNEGDRV